MNKTNNVQWLQGRSEKELDFDIKDWGLIESFQEDIYVDAHIENKIMSEVRKRYE